MKNLEAGGPAFPAICKSVNGVPLEPGMTLRDYFAAKAMPTMIVDGAALEAIKVTAKKTGEDALILTAKMAYAYADAMLAAREAQ